MSTHEEWTWLPMAKLVVRKPEQLSNDDCDDLVAWLELIIRSVRQRQAAAAYERAAIRMAARP